MNSSVSLALGTKLLYICRLASLKKDHGVRETLADLGKMIGQYCGLIADFFSFLVGVRLHAQLIKQILSHPVSKSVVYDVNDAKDKVFIFSRETNVKTSGFTAPSRDRFCCACIRRA